MNAMRHLVPAILLLLLPSCAEQDFERSGTWQATGANEANLRAMLAEPSHAVRGVADTTARGGTVSMAVRRLDEDRRRPLPDSRAAQIGSAPSPTGGGAPPAGGGSNGN
jgi:hypothetical protein